MKKYLVIGNPIDHSLSPKLQNYWIKLNKIEAIYGKLQAHDEDLKELARLMNEKDKQLVEMMQDKEKQMEKMQKQIEKLSNKLQIQNINNC